MVTQYSPYSVVDSNKGGARRGQPFDRLIDMRAPVPMAAFRAGPARVHVKLQAVRSRLWLRHALEVDARAAAVRIGDRARVIPSVLPGPADTLGDLFPGSGAVTRAWAAYTRPPASSAAADL